MMVHCYLLIVSMVILWCLFSDVGTAVKIDIDPPTIPEVPVSNTSTVTFLCTADAQEDSAGRVSSIQLLRKGGQVLALAKPDIVSSFLYNEDDYYDVTAIGHIRLSEQDAEGSYLNLTLRNPEKEDGGTYACHVAFNKSESGNAIVNKAKGFLSVDKPEVKGVGEKVAELEKTIGREDEKITKVGKEKKTRESNTFQLVEKTKRQDKDIKSVTRDEKKVEDKFGKMKENTNKRLKAVKELSQKNEAEVKSLKGSVNKLAERYKRDEDELKEIGEKETGDHWRVKDLAMKAGRRTVEIKDLMAKETKLEETVNEIEINIRNSLKKMKEISWTKSDSIAKLSVLVPKSTVHEPDLERLEEKTNELMVAITELEERLEKGVQDFLSMTTPEEEPVETIFASTAPTPSNEDDSNSNSDSDSDSDSDSKSDSDSMVAFAATNQDTPIKVEKRMTLVFSDYILKTKLNAYNEKTGVFLAPVDGLYHFSLIIKVDCVSCHVVTDIVVNKKTMVLRLKTGVMFDDKQNSASSVVQLRRNDQVKVVVVSTTEAAQVTLSTNRTCVFSGHLVTPFW